jgi:hypothetical protein
MNLMLAVLMASVAIGLLTPRFERPVYLLLAVLATVMTALYYFTTRFM